MTGFIAYVFLYPNRVPLEGALEVLEPDDGKLSRPVLRGPNPSNGVRLLDTWPPVGATDAGPMQIQLRKGVSVRCAEAGNPREVQKNRSGAENDDRATG